MPKIISLFLTIVLILAVHNANAQSGVITTVAGNGTSGYSGDGGPATAAELDYVSGVAIDAQGNFYIAEHYNNRIRKINSNGIISTIAGTGALGLGGGGYSGDNGPATAATLNAPYGIVCDGIGNIYFSDAANNRVRKINPEGIISTIAGNGSAGGYAGDGGAATAATLNGPAGLAIDRFGNIYIADCSNNVVRKVNNAGIISTFAGIAGSGGYGSYSGDGGPATAAHLSNQYSVVTDQIGNIYIGDWHNYRMRKVDTFGIITTVAGNGINGFSGDGGLATDAEIFNAAPIFVDYLGNIYIGDGGNYRVRKVDNFGYITTIAGNGISGYTGDGGIATVAEINGFGGITQDCLGNIYGGSGVDGVVREIHNNPDYTSDSFSIYTFKDCRGINFKAVTNRYSVGQHILSFFGNGKNFDTITACYISNGFTNFFAPYTSSGTYTIKHVLYDGTMPVDSISYSYLVSLCQSFSLGFYYDSLSTCIYNDSEDKLLPLPVVAEVDSNGIAIDTVSATSGLHYTAYGNPGDVYSFRIISNPAGLYLACPSSGNISDTLFSNISATKYFGFHCTGSGGFDLGETISARAYRNLEKLHIEVNNAYCNTEIPTLSLTFSPKYFFVSSFPAPYLVSGNVVTWNLDQLSILNSTAKFNVTLHAATLLLLNDTVTAKCVVYPVTGDLDTLNNFVFRIDTVKSSFDPNEMSVVPNGCIYADTVTTLQYTILFENTGNDTAHNIYVMDTLSDNLNPHTLRIVSASNVMNVSKWYDSTYHNIYKFEFPGINLLDSSHHNQCDGMFIFNIKTRAGLTGGSTIFNHAGIFFDDNPVVMTDTVENVMGCTPLVVSTKPVHHTLNLYPNPSHDVLTITDNELINNVTISDLPGRTLYNHNFNSTSVSVDVTSLPDGMYFVKINGTEVRKFVKE